MILPWQLDEWRQCWRRHQEKSMPHALLLTGMPGIGKLQFAEVLTQALLCKSVKADGMPCGECHPCRLIIGEVHPNVLKLMPEKAGQAIKVDQVREANEFLCQSSLQGEYKIVIIHPANQMNLSAANALLKTLEEPSSGSLIFLISDQRDGLPATILSRCQTLAFKQPSHMQALSWLQDNIEQGKRKKAAPVSLDLVLRLANGAPLAALRLMQDDVLEVRQQLFQALCSLGDKSQMANPLTLAAKNQSSEPLQLLDYLLSWIIDLLRLQLRATPDVIVNQDYADALVGFSKRISLQASITFMNYLQHLRGEFVRGFNLNKLLIIESSLIQWRNMLCS